MRDGWEESAMQVLACPGRRIQLVPVPDSQPVPPWAQEAPMGTHGVRSHRGQYLRCTQFPLTGLRKLG